MIKALKVMALPILKKSFMNPGQKLREKTNRTTFWDECTLVASTFNSILLLI